METLARTISASASASLLGGGANSSPMREVGSGGSPSAAPSTFMPSRTAPSGSTVKARRVLIIGSIAEKLFETRTIRKSRPASSQRFFRDLPPLTGHRAKRDPQRLAGNDIEARMRHPNERLLAHDLDVLNRGAIGHQRDVEFMAANTLGKRRASPRK